MANLIVPSARTVHGTLTLPGDKSISHRALLLGALCQGTTRILHCLDSDDVQRSRSAIEVLGVPVTREGEALMVEGRGLQGLKAPQGSLEMGNSGTTTRLLLGILAGCPFKATLVGDTSLSSRPMRRVTEPLEKMGATIRGAHGNDRLPLTIQGGSLKGIRHALSVPSAQVKSALLLAGCFAQGPTTVVEPIPTRDHTERMLSFLGARMIRQGTEVTIEPGGALRGRELEVPGDFSGAAFFLVAAAILPGASMTVKHVGLNPTRTGLLKILQRMGAQVQVVPRPGGAWEPVGEVTVSFGPLRGVTVEASEIPGVIDELPILTVAATQARGITRLEGVGELRVKETDRIRSMVTGLSMMGGRIRSEVDTVIVEGPTPLKGQVVDSFGDHRTAMALAIAGLVAEGKTMVQGSEWINISFPEFEEILKSIRR